MTYLFPLLYIRQRQIKKIWWAYRDPNHLSRWYIVLSRIAKGSETRYLYPSVRHRAGWDSSGHRDAGTAIQCKQNQWAGRAKAAPLRTRSFGGVNNSIEYH